MAQRQLSLRGLGPQQTVCVLGSGVYFNDFIYGCAGSSCCVGFSLAAASRGCSPAEGRGLFSSCGEQGLLSSGGDPKFHFFKKSQIVILQINQKVLPFPFLRNGFLKPTKPGRFLSSEKVLFLNV